MKSEGHSMDTDIQVNLPDSEVHEYSEEESQQKNSMKEKSGCREKHWLGHIRKKLRFLLHHHYFQIMICVLVLIDTAVVVTEIMVETSNKDGSPNHDMEVAEKVLHFTSLTILSFFMVEIITKIFAMGKEFLHHKFEIFDAVIVTVSFLLDVFLSSGGLKDGVEFLILLRLWRITRIINGIIVSIKTRAEEREEKLRKEKDEVMERCNQLELTVEVQKKKIEYLKQRLLSASIDVTAIIEDEAVYNENES
ncbi:voltage-gated hydrogen channel 1-like isoform X2 [Hydractinia symbiolongicarpus]|uniref:voltage-gated hydrogen channel 1-like isoform X2 n=1 Tax=Hydractinia symbiolongicarpus TaxID=13093 RepID=UPI00254FC5E0|nr:voltage-gated hydrogen channel 1-like isoform X2 [Hydractinia symbiolongicarpus]